MTKEEILKKDGLYESDETYYYPPKILESMDEYAKLHTYAFIKWMAINNIVAPGNLSQPEYMYDQFIKSRTA